MPGRTDFTKLDGPHVFQSICERQFSRLYPDFHPVNQAGGDQGVDGIMGRGEIVLQWTHRSGNVPLRVVRDYLGQATALEHVRKWVFASSKSLSIQSWRYLESQRISCPFQIEVWEGARLAEELSKHADLVDEFFPEYSKKAYEGTEAIRGQISRVEKAVTRAGRKRPKAGDAVEGSEISEDEKSDLRDLIVQMAEEEAKRRHRKPLGADYGREYSEFNSHFELSAYERLPRERFAEAREWLGKKRFARRNREPQYFKIERETNGIYGIARELGWTEEERRRFFFNQTKKYHLKEMTRGEIHLVFDAMRKMQNSSFGAGSEDSGAWRKQL